jgi:hypothetical protein
MADPIDFSKFRIPLGSLIVDATLVGVLVWSMATMTAKLDEMSRRIAAVERVDITPEAARRISVIETREVEFLRRMDKLDNKVDLILDRLPKR